LRVYVAAFTPRNLGNTLCVGDVRRGDAALIPVVVIDYIRAVGYAPQ